MRIAIFGSGSVGGYFGGRLAQGGAEVSFLARGEHLRALRQDGLRVESVHGDFHLHPIRATDDPAQLGEVDFVLLAVKTWQVAGAARAMAPLLSAGTTVVTLQNGVDAPATVAEVVGPDRVLPGLAKIISFVEAPGRIRHLGGPASLSFAEWDGRSSERVVRLTDAFRRSNVEVEVPQDIRKALWEKFIFVAPLGALGAVSRAPIGPLRTLPETRETLERLTQEVIAVGRARGVRLDDDTLARTLAFVDAQPAAGTTSLHRDITDGRPSELDSWVGSVVRQGEEVGVLTPLSRLVYHALLPLERRARGELEFAD